MGIVEEAEEVQKIRDILRQVRGIGAIWAGPSDMSVSMGLRGQASHARKSAARPGRLQIVRRPVCDWSHG